MGLHWAIRDFWPWRIDAESNMFQILSASWVWSYYLGIWNIRYYTKNYPCAIARWTLNVCNAQDWAGLLNLKKNTQCECKPWIIVRRPAHQMLIMSLFWSVSWFVWFLKNPDKEFFFLGFERWIPCRNNSFNMHVSDNGHYFHVWLDVVAVLAT